MTNRTPGMDSPMTQAETDLVYSHWRQFKAEISALTDEPGQLELLKMFSPIVGKVFDLRKTVNDIWQQAEDRHYGRLDVVRPFRRGVSPKSAPPTRAPKENLLTELGITEEQLTAAMRELNLLSPPEGGSGDET